VGAETPIGSIEAGKKGIALIDLDVPACGRPLIQSVSTLVHYGHPGIVTA